MDRNTLLAFFLISLVLVFTPKYMELVSPPPAATDNYVLPTDSLVVKSENTTKTKERTYIKQTQAISKSTEETLTSVNTSLYSLQMSSFFGGTVKSHLLNEYLTSDSQLVSIINSGSHRNIFISGKDLDGKDLPLSKNWVLQSFSRDPASNNQTIVYKHEVFPDRFIYKSFTFYDNSYIIDIALDLTSISQDIYRDVFFGWAGGLLTTESNTKDDLSYFNSYVYQGGELENLKTGSKQREEYKYNGQSEWVAIRTKYFTAAIIPDSPEKIRSAILGGQVDTLETYDISMLIDPFDVQTFRLYIGPLEFERIKNINVGLESIMDFGWSFIRPISKGVLFALRELHKFVPNYGVVLIIFSILVKLLVYPLTKKSYQSTAAMQAVAPEINALKEKYQSNPQKLNQATMELYKKKGVNPLGGCLPMLLQMPLLLALFQVFRSTIELRAEPFIWWIKDLSSPDTIFYLPFNVPIYGDQVAVLPVIMVFSMFVQQKMMTGANQQPQQKMMQSFMMGFFFLLFNTFPSGLNLYYTLFNLLTIAQQKLIPKENATTKSNQ